MHDVMCRRGCHELRPYFCCSSRKQENSCGSAKLIARHDLCAAGQGGRVTSSVLLRVPATARARPLSSASASAIASPLASRCSSGSTTSGTMSVSELVSVPVRIFPNQCLYLRPYLYLHLLHLNHQLQFILDPGDVYGSSGLLLCLGSIVADEETLALRSRSAESRWSGPARRPVAIL